MTAFDYTKRPKRRTKQRAKQPKSKGVHPNSMAARKWGRKEWRTSS